MSIELLSDEKIFKCVKSAGIPERELVLVGGAALQLHGIKQTTDVDAVISMPQLITRIRRRQNDPQLGQARMHSSLGGEAVTDRGNITFPILDWKEFYEAESTGTLTLMPAPNDRLYSVSFEELRDEAIDMQGVLVAPPERILDWKQAVGRAKDLQDIELIQSRLAQPAN